MYDKKFMWNSGIKSPCFKCDNRILNCHSTCENYAEFKGNIDKINKKVFIEKGKDVEYMTLQVQKANRLRR